METPNMPYATRVSMLRGYLYNYAIKLTQDHNEADDLVQDTIIKALETQKDYNEEGHIKAWLITIMRNKHIDNIRRNNRRRVQDVDNYAELLPAPPDALSALACTDIRRSVTELSGITSRIIEMRIEGYSFDEIGDELGIKKGNARVRACHAYKKLKGNTK